VQRLRHELGLDRPFLVRYSAWVRGAATGDLGQSYRTGRSVSVELRERVPRTFALAAAALVVALTVGSMLALGAARQRDSLFDHAACLIALAGASTPSYWMAYVLILLFAVALHAFPVEGAGDLRHLVLPALTLAIGGAAGVTRLLRANLLDEMGAEYMRTARAKGRSTTGALFKHALRNALNPVVTVAALRFGRLLGEAVIVETIFAWPGVGRFVVDAIYDRDYPAIQGAVLYLAVVFSVVNLVADLCYRLLDPRIRFNPALEAA
jgi:peptide/nickel transport system permease protein